MNSGGLFFPRWQMLKQVERAVLPKHPTFQATIFVDQFAM
jgi:hypothetical protein